MDVDRPVPVPPEDTDEVYRKQYKMRGAGEDGLNIVVTIPPLVVAKEARKRGLTPKQFIQQFRAVATFNGFEGVFYNFEPIPDKDEVALNGDTETNDTPEG